MKPRTYRIILTPEPEGGYTVGVPSLPGCITYGETIEQAQLMAREAIELYIETLIADNLEIPDDTLTLEYSVVISS